MITIVIWDIYSDNDSDNGNNNNNTNDDNDFITEEE